MKKENNINQAGIKAGEKMYKDLIALISCFPVESRYYWIKRLKVNNAIKGYLLFQFNLL